MPPAFDFCLVRRYVTIAHGDISDSRAREGTRPSLSRLAHHRAMPCHANRALFVTCRRVRQLPVGSSDKTVRSMNRPNGLVLRRIKPARKHVALNALRNYRLSSPENQMAWRIHATIWLRFGIRHQVRTDDGTVTNGMAGCPSSPAETSARPLHIFFSFLWRLPCKHQMHHARLILGCVAQQKV